MTEAFRAHLSNILPGEAAAILEALASPQFPSLRYNPSKPALRHYSGHTIPWEEQSVQLSENPAFIRDPQWHAGAYYVQESSSMFLGHILRHWLQENTPAEPLLALDLCAAPGGKSTHLLDVLPADALLVTNEMISKRNAILRENLIRWGRPNVVVTQNEPADLRPCAHLFDLVVVDAPCSGEGLFRRDRTAIQEWSPEAVQYCALRQHDILDEAVALVKTNGLLLYSTCTFEPAENEAQVERLLHQGFVLVPAAIQLFPQITEGLLPGTYRFYPHKTPGSGFFIACLKKVKPHDIKNVNNPVKRHRKNTAITPSAWKEAGQWIEQPDNYAILQTPYSVHAFPKDWTDVLQFLNQHLRITYFGTELGELKKDLFIPAHALALSTMIRPDLPAINTDLENALKYLRKETLDLPGINGIKQGWQLLRHESLNLGWIKVLPGRINNYLPAAWRILH